MKVTIVVRTFNRPTYLREALTSLALQSHTDWELLFFDDAASESNLKIFKEFKSHHSDKRMIYMSSDTPYDMFQQSWLISPDLANGEIMIRLDDDDILAENCLSFLSDVYEKNTELDFSYGSCATFNENGLYQVVQTMNPFEAPKTKDEWAAYTLPNNNPWDLPWSFIENYYKEPKHYTSIIHCAKANIMCIYHTYAMRTESVRKVKNKITITSNFIDDLEFLGSLDYLGLRHASIKKITSYVRLHNTGRVSDTSKVINGINIYKDNFIIRDKVEHLRPSGFLSHIIPIESEDNFNNGLDEVAINNFNTFKGKIDSCFIKIKKTENKLNISNLKKSLNL